MLPAFAVEVQVDFSNEVGRIKNTENGKQSVCFPVLADQNIVVAGN